MGMRSLIGLIVLLTIPALAFDPTAVEGPEKANTTPSTTKGIFPMSCVGKSTAPSSVTDGNVTRCWADQIGRVHITGDTSMTALKVDGSAATQPVTITDGTDSPVVFNPALEVLHYTDKSLLVSLGASNDGIPSQLPGVAQEGENTQSSGTTVTVTLTPSLANTFIAVCGVNNTGTLTLSDNRSNIWRTASSRTGTVAGVLIGYATIISTSSTTITCTAGTSGVIGLHVYEYSTLLDQASSGGGLTHDASDSNTGSAQTTATLLAGLSPQQPNEQAIVGIMLTTNTAMTASGVWTLSNQLSGTSARFVAARQFLPSVGGGLTPSSAVTTFSSASYALAAATFRTVSLPIQGTVQLMRPDTATETNVNDTASSTSLLSANNNRRGASIFNDSTVALYVRLSSSNATTTAFTVKILPGGYYELPIPVYTGAITGIWDSDASGAARITEMQ